MTSFKEKFPLFAARMQAEGLPETFIRSFASYYEQLLAGDTGLILEKDIAPVASLPDGETLPDRLLDVGEAALASTAVIKLNGGLGTSMGLEKAKSLLEVKEGLSFLEITARQANLANVPLILMNSFATDADCLLVVGKYGDNTGGLPRSFIQHKEPKIRADDLLPVDWPRDPELEWCPPGHGDIYVAMVTSGTLDALLEAGYKYAFVSNADNLGAVIERRILGYFTENEFPFLMEVADRTEMDKKGGHLAMRPDGQLILRELAQTAAEDLAAFQDIAHHQYFNTNNLWLNLEALKALLVQRDSILGLPLIRNAKTVDPRDAATPAVFQLETAMGSAIAVFKGAQAVRVSRRRFAPVKKTDDLAAVRSDAYVLTDKFRVIPNPECQNGTPLVSLDPQFFRFVTDLDARFPYGVPSLAACRSLSICGDFRFGRGVVCQGQVELVNQSGAQVAIPDGTVLEGRSTW